MMLVCHLKLTSIHLSLWIGRRILGARSRPRACNFLNLLVAKRVREMRKTNLIGKISLLLVIVVHFGHRLGCVHQRRIHSVPAIIGMSSQSLKRREGTGWLLTENVPTGCDSPYFKGVFTNQADPLDFVARLFRSKMKQIAVFALQRSNLMRQLNFAISNLFQRTGLVGIIIFFFIHVRSDGVLQCLSETGGLLTQNGKQRAYRDRLQLLVVFKTSVLRVSKQDQFPV